MKYVLISSESKETSIMYRGIHIQDRYFHVSLKNRRITDKIIKKWLYPKEKGTNKVIRWILNSGAFKQIEDDARIKKHDSLCFIVMAGIYEVYGNELVEFIRNTYPDSKVVCYFVDLIRTLRVGINCYKNAFDALYTFDLREAEIYKMNYCMEPFSFYEIERKNKIYDVTFVGKAKGRLKEILEIYEALVERGFTCDFHIVGVKKEEQKYRDHITYNKFMSFEEILEHISKSRCVLEIMQDHAYSPTTRYAEAMLYGINLLSDCESIGTEEYPADSNVLVFTDINRIDYNFIRSSPAIDRKKYEEFFSIERFLQSIKKGLVK